uniref:NADH dehydrogenase [ubiquinone] 1 beta subcomplex subunit 5, mitochondrial n=1 Tax=Onchocerca volvulus TaxID=6282 RepID=A0A8R1TLH3_ONCVO
MVVFSKLAKVNWLCSTRLIISPARFSSDRVFYRRPSVLYFNRCKDVAHFYVVGLGIMPMILLLGFIHIVYGPCELQDLPTDGSAVHYWQFERTKLKQWAAKYLCPSDIEQYERNLAYFEKANILSRWRKIEQRVEHLQGERWDYKAWWYEPVSAAWTDYGKWIADRMKNQPSEF